MDDFQKWYQQEALLIVPGAQWDDAVLEEKGLESPRSFSQLVSVIQGIRVEEGSGDPGRGDPEKGGQKVEGKLGEWE